MKVIDLVAADVPICSNARRPQAEGVGYGAALQNADVVATAVEPDWRTRFLSVITDPSIAYVLILLESTRWCSSFPIQASCFPASSAPSAC